MHFVGSGVFDDDTGQQVREVEQQLSCGNIHKAEEEFAKIFRSDQLISPWTNGREKIVHQFSPLNIKLTEDKEKERKEHHRNDEQ